MSFRRQVKNFVKNYSEAEKKVREATSNDPWGPSSSLMLAISDMTFNAASLSEIMHMLWQRLSDHGKNWRHVYKSLALMDYLIKNGSRKVIQYCREGICNLQMLKDFQHIDEAGKDQGHYIRERSRQVITLLMDEQLLYKEREVAMLTRQRTSYSMSLPGRLPATGNSPAECECASILIPESLTSETKHLQDCKQTAGLLNKKNTAKVRLRLEQCQDVPSPAGTSLPLYFPSLGMKAWKSTEDLTLLYSYEYPKQPLPRLPPSITSPASWLSEGEAEISSLCDTEAVSTPPEKSPSMQTNKSLGKRLEKAIADTVAECPPQTPQEKQTAAKSFEMLTPLQAFWPSGKDEFISLGLRTSKSESMFHNQSSVETLYVSPAFKTLSPLSESSKDLQTPAWPSICRMEDVYVKPLAVRVSAVSEVASSFSTLSLSPPDSAHPEKSARCFTPVLTSSSFWTLPQSQSPSDPFTYKNEAVRVRHPFAPTGTASSDDEEYPDLPDNSDSAMKKSSYSPSSCRVAFPTLTRAHFPGASQARFQESAGLPRDSESRAIRTLLGEVKSAVVRLHEDLSLVIQELGVINSHLGNLSGSSPAVSETLQDPQSPRESPDPV
ncbi:ENTH domain-containing protein 1 isoform X2 [Mastomys coucha]|uniref:ENTH domain-containing protein 1 isoform X2 n=1 Tax=Mastomys coucha TaxID=35658 RepID=UPI001262798C|nr:ENTH domain-containing protein 1 isoform X2 [Mastomys coucha]